MAGSLDLTLVGHGHRSNFMVRGGIMFLFAKSKGKLGNEVRRSSDLLADMAAKAYLNWKL